MNDKCAIYVRVSTHWQVDKDSLQVQKRELAMYSEIVLEIKDYTIFEDPGYSAKNTDRPAYQQMMSQLRSGEYSHLLVWKIDRISRNLLDFSQMYKELKDLGITFVSKNEQFDTSSAIGEAMLKIILVFAELERGMTSERVSATMMSRASNGQWNGGRIPYGYNYDKNTQTFSINEKEAKIYLAIVETYEESQSILYTARKMNELGYRSRKGNEWSPPAIWKLLTSVFYTGDMRYNVTDSSGNNKDESEWITVEDHHIALLSRERHKHIQYVLNNNKRLNMPKLRPVTYAGNMHVFDGLVKCGICGSNMTATKDRRRANGYRPSMYMCGKRRRSNSCTNKYISDVALVPFVFQIISNLLTKRELIMNAKSKSARINYIVRNTSANSITDESLESLLSQYTSNQTPIGFAIKKKDTDTDEFTTYQSQKKKLELALTRLKNLYLYGTDALPEKDYLIERQNILDKIKKLDKAISEQTPKTSEEELTQKASYFLMVSKILENNKDFICLVRDTKPEVVYEFIHSIISEIHVIDGHVSKLTFSNKLTITFT